MPRGKKDVNELYYFSRQLRTRINGIDKYPLTVIEAPSGYGKTTVVREHLKEYAGTPVHTSWYTCMGEAPEKTWSGICNLFTEIDSAASEELIKLGLPTSDSLADLVLILRKLRCQNETYIVIDNFQLFMSSIKRQIIKAFSVHGNDRLHMIFITQPLTEKTEDTVHNTNIYQIGYDDLTFDKEGIRVYFRMSGLTPSEDELESIYNSTEGWVAAIRLQMLNYQQRGMVEHTGDIEQLIRIAVWNKLTTEAKSFFLSVSVLDCFTTKQARMMLEEKELSGSIKKQLENNSFIRYFPEKDLYYMHSILQDFLRKRFYNRQPEEFQKIILRRAGDACAAEAQYFPAARFYYEVSDFDAILSLPFDSVYLNNQKEKAILEFIVELIQVCPEEILRKYPMAIIGFAFQLFMGGWYVPFGKLSRLISSIIEKPDKISEEELHRIKGEFALLNSFTAYNDIQKMSEGHKEAMKHLDSPSKFLLPTAPWTFMNISVLTMYWRKTGELEKELEYMDECMPYYSKLAKGHGTGADSVMRAEAMLLRGADEEAEALCHKAIYLGREQHQIALCICAELLLARIAMLRGDEERYLAALENMRRYTDARPERFLLRIAELCRASLSLTLGDTKELEGWLNDLESIKKVLYTPALPQGNVIYAKQLLLNKRYHELYGLTEPMLKLAEKMNYLLMQVYHLIYLTVARNAQGQNKEAQEALTKALAIALPDQIYLPFAEMGEALLPMLEFARSGVSREELDRIIELAKRQGTGMKTIQKKLNRFKSPLTPRERDIALLAKERLSAREIAETLFITESTVRSVLKKIYGKLNIHAKSELSQVEF